MKYYLVRLSCLISRIASELKYKWKQIVGRVSKPEALQALQEKCKKITAEDFNEYLRKNYNYVADGMDYSKHPLIFIHEKIGDCDDYATLAANILPIMGYEVYLISVFADIKRGHAVCIGKKDDKVYGFGNWPLMYFDNDNFIEVGKKICKIGYNTEVDFIVKYDKEWNFKDYYEHN